MTGNSNADQPLIAPALLAWYDRHGRHDLPWQQPRTPYRVWVAEIMLQQTQVSTVIPYYQRFVVAFPDLPSLAAVNVDAVLAHWAGLGYYSRGRNLHRAAQLCAEHHGGELPADFDALLALPGIGRSTAGAILAQAFEQPVAILDGNVRRVLGRCFAIAGWPGESAVQRRYWAIAQAQTPTQRVVDYTQAIMDLGATVCSRSRPACDRCPLAVRCLALAHGSIAFLPTAKPRKARPVRQLSMLWLRDNVGHTLLERRPPSGIWGGLWSLPEIDWLDRQAGETAAAMLAHWCSQRGYRLASSEALPNFVHDFSHYRLQVQPWRLKVAQRKPAQLAEVDHTLWVDASDLAGLGLPSPVQRLLFSMA